MTKKTLYIPRGTEQEYDSLDVPSLIVHGVLRVHGTLTAKNIEGKGVIHAGSIRFQTMRINVADAESLSGRELIANQLLCDSCHVSGSVTAASYVQAAELETGCLTMCLSSIADCKAEQITVLAPKKRGILRLAAASWLQAIRGALAYRRAKAAKAKRPKSTVRKTKARAAQPDPAVVRQVLDYLRRENLLAGTPEPAADFEEAA